ncbi:MAG: type II toxin-antitoxin system prevent-host-death family antitoxin [Polyangia bacterium]
MKATEIGVFDTKTHLSDILRRVSQGERFYITRRGERVALLGPVESGKRPLERGCAANDGYFMADDFDDPIEGMEDYL